MSEATGDITSDPERPERIQASGAVLWRTGATSTEPEVALVHRPRYDDWSLPKGKARPGETRHATAVREVAEETGVRPVLNRLLGEVAYTLPDSVPGGPLRKTVRYYAAKEVTEAAERPADDEIDQVSWFPLSEAADRLSYPHDRVILRRFAELPADTRTLLLVRHAKAGRRSDWAGPDGLRPLSEAGRQQASALSQILPLFGPDQVFSSPRTRCRQTVEPTAAVLGLTVHDEPLLSEEEYPSDPDRTHHRLLELLSSSPTTLLCSQGAVIPSVVRWLGEQTADGVNPVPEDPPNKKGSLWVLSFHPTRPELLGVEHISSAEDW